jgi:ATP-binding cassette, subfamily B, bacterial MsbA
MSFRHHWQAIRTLLQGVEWQYLSLFFLSCISAVLELVSLGLVFPLLHLVLRGETLGLPALVATIISGPPLYGSFERVAAALVMAFIAKSIGKFFVEYGNAKITNQIRGGWMTKLFASYISRHYVFFLKQEHGSLIHNLFDLTDQCMSAFRQMVNIAMYGISSAIVLAAMVSISWPATLAIVAAIGAIYALSRPLATASVRLGVRRLDLYHKVNNIPTEAFKGIREVKTYSAQQYIQNLYGRAVRRMVALRVSLNFYQLLPGVVPEPLLIIFLIVALVVLQRRGVDVKEALPLMATYIYAAYRLVVNASALAKDVVTYVSHIPSIRLLAEAILELPDGSSDAPSGHQAVPTAAAPLAFEAVSFAYQPGVQTLRSVTFSCQPKKLTAIVGPSGSGKSTIADLMIRLYTPHAGRIIFGGRDITDFALEAWRQGIGFVSQDTFLFHGTIKENIALGFAEHAGDPEIEAAAKRAHAHDFIVKKPSGYDTVVGERGALLSGGQRQRIAIARALMRNPRVLILDEATSALDAASQTLIMDTLQELRGSMTIVMITHQLSIAAQADHIIFLQDGQVQEQGTHADLMARRGMYYATVARPL